MNGSTGAVRSSLGISAKSLHAGGMKKRDLAEGYKPIEGRQIRYDLQRVAQSVLYDRDSMKQHRTCACSRNVASDGVSVYRAVDGSDARFANLITCGNVWTCPVCSEKVREARRHDVQAAIDKMHELGGSIALMTLTFPHSMGDDLEKSLSRFQKALTKFKNSRVYRNLKDRYGVEFTRQRSGEDVHVAGAAIRSLEVTYGKNGWHPHTHDLLFLRVAKDLLLQNTLLIDELKREWAKQVMAAGLGDNSDLNDILANGLDLRGGDYAAEYALKWGREPKLYHAWGAAREITKGMSKIAAGEHATPFMLLVWASNGDEIAAGLFRRYAAEFDGKRMLSWSPGLKAYLLGDDSELTDEEIAQQEEVTEQEEFVYRISTDDWKNVLSRNARFEVLRAAAAGGADAIKLVLIDLKGRPITHSGTFLDYARPRFEH